MTAIEIDPSKGCANCHENATGTYCSVCGQKANAERLNTADLLQSGLRTILEMDSKIWITFRDLFRNPGKVALNYISGARIRYINPVKMFFATVAVSVALTLWFGELDASLQDMTAAQEPFAELDRRHGSDIAGFMAEMPWVLQNLIQLAALMVVPLFSLFLWLQHRKRGRNYAETLVFGLYLSSLSNIISIVISLSVAMTMVNTVWLKPIPLIIYFIIGTRTYFGLSPVRTIFSTLFSLLLYLLATYLIMFVLTYLKYVGLF